MGCCSSTETRESPRRRRRTSSTFSNPDGGGDGQLQQRTVEVEGLGEMTLVRCPDCHRMIPDMIFPTHARNCSRSGGSGGGGPRTAADVTAHQEEEMMNLLILLALLSAANEREGQRERIRHGTIDDYSFTTVLTPATMPRGEQSTACTICLNNFEVGDNVRTLPCFHMFHKGCIDEWVQKSAVCPMCRENPEKLAREAMGQGGGGGGSSGGCE